MVKYNKQQTRSYKESTTEFSFDDNSPVIYMLYSEEYLTKLKNKGVNVDLIEWARETANQADIEFGKMRKRITEYEKMEKERKQIELYKKAILELKQEGKI